MRFRARLLLVALAAVVAAGCSVRFEGFQFQTADGGHVAIWQQRGVNAADAVRLGASRPDSPVFHLASLLTVTPGSQAFALSYSGDLAGATLSILSDRKTVLKTAQLPAPAGNPLRYLVPLQNGARIWGYQVTGTQGSSGSLTILGAGTTTFVHGFSISSDTLTVDGSVEVLSASARAVSARIAPAAREEMNAGIWRLSLFLGAAARGGRATFTGAGGERAVFDVNPASAPSRLDFARGSIPFLPSDVSFAGALQGLEILRVPADAPIPADLGTILTWERSAWRRPDFEVFSWTLFPRVLVFDTASYDVQDALFKRLAFFVEKAGHAGRLETTAALAGLHGYNAHDYRAEDLARFFTIASATPPGLSAEESALATILTDNGVMMQSTDGWEPGDGCVLAISRSSPALLRELLLIHESFHGVFFTLPAFREATERVWSGLSEVEQEVWKDYLGAHGYDVSDHYLLVNEFQSYLMQQDRAGVRGYQDTTLSRLRTGSARSASLARQLEAAHPASFLASFDALDGALRAAGGPPGGLTLSVKRAAEPGG